jgi:predicted DsbA family dithiol-disulfide isomerase
VLREKKLRGWSEKKIATATNRVEEAGRSVGINFKHGGKIGHTRDAHRLISRSQEKGMPSEVRDALVEGIFEAYHELERDISNKEVLRDIAMRSGIEELEVHEWLNSDMDTTAVDEEAQHNREKVSNGVPTFFIQEHHRVDGAQDIQEFLEVFVKAKEGQP